MAMDSTVNWSTQGSDSSTPPTLGSTYPAIFGGWMASNFPSVSYGTVVTHIAAIQITFPDGFIAPLGITSSNISGVKGAGNFSGVPLNHNTNSVTINGQNLVNAVGSLTPNSWGSTVYPGSGGFSSPSGGNNWYSSSFTLNNNYIAMTGVSSYNYNTNGTGL